MRPVRRQYYYMYFTQYTNETSHFYVNLISGQVVLSAFSDLVCLEDKPDRSLEEH